MNSQKNMEPQAGQELSHSEQAQLEKVQQLVLSLEKCTRAQKLYMANNQILQQHFENLQSLFNNYLKEHGELPLQVTAQEFQFLGHAVYRNSNKKENFAFRLHSEGMRGIRFIAGLDAKEMHDFIELLNSVTHDSGTNQPATTLLWEREFDHISYEIAEYVIDAENEKQISEKMEQVLEPSMQHYLGPTPSGPPEDIEESFDAAELLPDKDFRQMIRDVCILEPKEFEQIQREIANGEKHERLMLDLFDIILTLILEEKKPEALGNLYQVLLENIDATVVHGELHITAQILWALRGMLEGGSGDFSMRHPDRILKIIDSLGTTERINRYLNCLNLGYTGSVKDIVNFFSSLPKRAFPVLLQQVHVISSPQLRKEISIAVAQLYDQQIEHFNKAFHAAKSAAQIIDILFILTHTRDERMAGVLTPLLQHANRAVRLACVQALRDFGTAESINRLQVLLEDSDHEIRLNVVRALAAGGDAQIGELLLEKIRAQAFNTLDIQEKRTYFHTTAKLMGDAMLPFLKNTLADSSFFRRRETDEIQQCAAMALTTIGSEDAIALLQHFEKNGSKTVRHHCAREMKRTSAHE